MIDSAWETLRDIRSEEIVHHLLRPYTTTLLHLIACFFGSASYYGHTTCVSDNFDFNLYLV